MRPFNLLQYPALDRQRKTRHRWSSSLAGLVVGVASAWGVLHWAQEALQQIQHDQTRLQTRLHELTRQQQTIQKQHALQKTWDQQALHLGRVGHQQVLWQALHRALLQEPNLSSVRFLRLQMDADKFELHGIAPDVVRMDSARERLSRALMEAFAQGGESMSKSSDPVRAPTLALSSLVLSDAGLGGAAESAPRTAELAFVWQGAWPLIGKAQGSAVPVDQPLQARKASP